MTQQEGASAKTTIQAEESKGYIELEPGVYPATLIQLECVDGQFGQQAKLIFELDGITVEDGSAANLWAWASWKLNPMTKLWSWVVALMDEPPTTGESFDLQALIGAPCRLLVETHVTEQGKWARVNGVLPAERAAKKSAGKQPAVEPATQQPPTSQQIASALGLKGQLQELWGTRGMGEWLIANCPDALVPVGEGAKRVHTFSVEHLTMRDAGAAIIKLQDALGNERPPEPDELPFEEPAK